MKRIALRPTTILTVIITYKLHGLTLEHVIDCGLRLILMTPTKPDRVYRIVDLRP